MPFLAAEADIHILAAGGNQRVVKSATRVFPIFQQGSVSIGNQYIAGVEENLAKDFPAMPQGEVLEIAGAGEAPEVDNLCPAVIDDFDAVTA